jgi:hypothetical protein
MMAPGNQVAAAAGDPADVHRLRCRRWKAPSPSSSLAISPDWRRVVLQRRSTRDSMLVCAHNFSGTCCRVLPRGVGSRPHELSLAVGGWWWAQGSGWVDGKTTRRRCNTVHYSTLRAWGGICSLGSTRLLGRAWRRRMGCCGWRRRRMGACDSAGAHHARRVRQNGSDRPTACFTGQSIVCQQLWTKDFWEEV